MSERAPSTDVASRRLVIVNERGLHARAAARFVAALDGLSARVDVEKDGVQVSGRSIMGLMMLAAGLGTTIAVKATGADAAEAVGRLASLVESRFDE